MIKRIVWTAGSVMVLVCAAGISAICTRSVDGQISDSIDRKQSVGQVFDQEPMLFFDVSGFGLGGPIHQRLAVYSSGLTSISAAAFEGQGAAEFTYVTVERVNELRAALVALGIENLQDNVFEVPDVPMKTVTFVRPVGVRGRANTYNYFLSEGAYAEVEDVVNEFMTETFPGFLDAGGQ